MMAHELITSLQRCCVCLVSVTDTIPAEQSLICLHNLWPDQLMAIVVEANFTCTIYVIETKYDRNHNVADSRIRWLIGQFTDWLTDLLCVRVHVRVRTVHQLQHQH
jgi:hypothetical protein